MRKKILSTTITLGILLSVGSNVWATPSTSDLDAAKSNAKSTQSNVVAAQNSAKELQAKIEEFDNEIQKTVLEINDTDNKIKQTEDSITQSDEAIKRAESNMKIQQEKFDKSMRTMYMSGSTGYIDVLLNSNGISDFVSKFEIVKKVSEYNDNVISNLKQRKEEIDKKKVALEAQRSSLVALKDEDNKKVAELNKQKASEQPLVDKANAELNNALALSDAAQKQVNSITSQIKAAQAAQAAPSINRGSIANISSSALVQFALRFQGVPYVWGGTSPSGFDCSGFVQYVYANFGVYLPRTSEEQFQVGNSVSQGDLQPGDLVFFHNSGDGPGHVGMYIGGGYMIHAPHTGDVVRIIPLAWESGYCGARRFK